MGSATSSPRSSEASFPMRLRVNYLFSPTLSLEAYGEPFSASGRYFGFGELEAAGSRFLREYGQAPGTTITLADQNYQVTDTEVPGSFGFRNPDFNSFSFRSNLVVRWEWNPGSTIFLVWQQNRSDFCSGGSVDLCPNGSDAGITGHRRLVRRPVQAPRRQFRGGQGELLDLGAVGLTLGARAWGLGVGKWEAGYAGEGFRVPPSGCCRPQKRRSGIIAEGCSATPRSSSNGGQSFRQPPAPAPSP